MMDSVSFVIIDAASKASWADVDEVSRESKGG